MSPAFALVVMAAVGCAAGAWAWSHLTRRRVLARLAGTHRAIAPGRDPAGVLESGGWGTGASPTPPLLAVRSQQPPGGAAAGAVTRRPAPVHVVAAIAGGAAALTGLVVTVGPLVLVAGALAAIAGAVAQSRHRRSEGQRLRRVQLPAALERLATALRAGSSVPAALAEVGAAMPRPIGPELAALGHEARSGRAVVQVLDGWSARHDDAGTRLAATALALATAVGGAPGHAVDGVAATLRERVDLADERRALASQARMSALVLAVAPVGFAVLLGAADGAAAAFLLGTPAGWVCLGAGVALDGLGAWWMTRLTAGGET